MKKRILCMVLIFGVLVCALSMTVLAEESSVDAFSLTCHDQTGYIGEEAEYYHLNQAVISYSFQPEETSETVTMVSDNPDVATVEYDSEHDSWYAHYHKLGTAVITATTESGLTDTCTITVKEIESVQINQPFTVTIQPNDKVHYQFEVDKSETYYSLYSENGEGLLRIDQGRPPFYGTGVDTQLLYVGTYVLTAYNKTDEPKTYTLCIKESVPAEKFVFEQDVYYGYPGDKVLTKGELYPLWHIPENAVLSSSDENIAYYTGTYRVTLASPGTATITATTSGGGVTQCTVIVHDYEPIQLGESKTITLPFQGEKRFTFTPEKDGEYYFYTPEGEFVPVDGGEYGLPGLVGQYKSFDLSIRCDGKLVSKNISMSGYKAVSCIMEAGKTYILSARNSILGDSEFTETVSLDELPKFFHSAQNIEKEDPYKQFSISETQGWSTSQYFYFRDLESTIFLRYNQVKSMDESIVKVSEYEFDTNKIQLEFLKSGSTTICYTHSDGTVHHIPVIVELPEYGFYTTPYASAETYLDSFTVTKESNVIYFVATQGSKIKDFVLGDGFPQGSAIEPSPDGSYIKITIGDFAGTNVHALVNWSDETYQCMVGDQIYLSSTLPGIYSRSPGYDEATESIFEDSNGTSSVSVQHTLGSFCEFYYYYDGENEHRLCASDLGVADPSVIQLEDDVMESGEETNMIAIHATKNGATTISYTAPDGNIYYMPVQIDLPMFGFYNNPAASADTYCFKQFALNGENDTVYLIVQQPNTIVSITPDESWPESVVEISEDGLYATIRIIGEADENAAYSYLVCEYTNPNLIETGTNRINYVGIKFSSTTDCITHTWNAGEETTVPTCTTDGAKTFTCTVCSETKIETLPAIGHSYTDGKCTVCGAADPDYAAPTPTPTPTPDVPDTAENPFTDVADADYFYRPVLWAVDNNITGGLGEGIFGPNEGCTRGQVVTFLWAANGKPEPKSMDNPFDDVADNAWYLKPVLWAVENGITGGTSATTFGPEQTCTRGQIVTFLWAANGKPAVEGESSFTDVTASDWFLNPVLWAAENNVTGGIGEGMFGPNNTCTRGQVVTFLYKVYNK